MRLLNAIAVTSFIFAATANAATYYVATNGNDAASGTLEAPFRTLHAAAKVAQPGDTFIVRGGTYTGRVGITVKGTAAAPVVFRAQTGETAILDGTGLAAGTPVVSFTDSEHFELSGFEVRNGPQIGISLWHVRNARIVNNRVHHMVRNGIYAGGTASTAACTDLTISGNTVHDTVLENQHHTMTTGGWAGAVVISRTDRATITNNRIYNNDGEGLISLRSNYATIRGNEISDNYSAYLYLDNARFVTADRNLIYSTGNTRYYRDGRPGAGIGIANETKDVMNPSSDNVITNNVVIGTRWGFYYGSFETGGGLKNTKVLHNTFYGTTEEIIRIENDTHANSVVANNIFFQTGSATPKYSGAGAVSYRNNLWYGGSAGVAAGTGDIIADPQFVNAGGRTAADYKLRPLSPAIHSAVDLTDVTATDHFGATRTPTADIGAHEQSLALGSSAPVTPSLFAPTGVAASVVNGAVHVTWKAADGAVEYDLYRDNRYVTTVGTTQFVDTTVAAGTTYSYELSSRNSRGTPSARSSAATVTVPNATPTAPAAPAAPASLQAIASATNVNLAWAAVNGAVSYSIYRDGAKIAAATGTTFADTTVDSATTYTYSVVAINAQGVASAASETISVTTASSSTRRRAVR